MEAHHGGAVEAMEAHSGVVKACLEAFGAQLGAMENNHRAVKAYLGEVEPLPVALEV
jgi:hypothetical protein